MFDLKTDKHGRKQLSKEQAEQLVTEHYQHVVMTKVAPLEWELTYGAIYFCEINEEHELDYLSDRL